MDPITQQTVIAAAGAGGGDPLYVDDVFSTYLYDGTGSARSINNGINFSEEGGMLWIKNRNGNGDHNVFDTINILQGAGKALLPNGIYGLQAYGNNSVNGFNNNGFSIGGSPV